MFPKDNEPRDSFLTDKLQNGTPAQKALAASFLAAAEAQVELETFESELDKAARYLFLLCRATSIFYTKFPVKVSSTLDPPTTPPAAVEPDDLLGWE
jgi:hypothetical protein